MRNPPIVKAPPFLFRPSELSAHQKLSFNPNWICRRHVERIADPSRRAEIDKRAWTGKGGTIEQIKELRPEFQVSLLAKGNILYQHKVEVVDSRA